MANHTMKTLCAAALGLALAHPAVAAEVGYETVDGIEYSYIVNADGASVTLHGIVTNNNDLPETLILPETLGGKPVTIIEEKAFQGANFVSLTLPAKLEQITAMSFYFTALKLTNILVAAGNTHFESKNGVLFKNDENGLRLVAYPSAREGANYDIPEGTTRLDLMSFYGCSNLERIAIPASLGVSGWINVKFIAECPKLVRVDVAKDNPNFHDEDGVLFLDTQRNPLQSRLLVYPAARTATAYTIPDHVAEVRSMAFAQSKNLEKVTFLDSETSLSLSDSIFDDCTNLKALYFNGAPPAAEYNTFLNTPDDLKVYYTGETHRDAWEAVYSDGGKWAICDQSRRPSVSFWNADGLPRDGETSYATETRTVAVPNAWLLENVPGLTENSTAADATAALAEPGKNGIPRWKSYLFGFEPDSDTPAAAQLKVSIDGFDAERRPIISWTPDQRTNDAVKDCVKYTIRAAMTLDKERPWSDYDKALWKKNFRFFYVEVEAQ